MKSIVLVGIVSIIPLAVVAINIYAYFEWKEPRYLMENGNRTMATVLDKETSGSAGKTVYRVLIAYRDTISAKDFVSEVEVDQGLYQLLTIESKHPIFVDAGDPERIAISGNEIHIKYMVYAGIADILLLIALSVLYRKYKKGAFSQSV